jgi:dTDP-4-dehydrorhamnose reductase
MKIALIGANGQLGTDIGDAYLAQGHEVACLTHKHLDVVDLGGCRERLRDLGPCLVINTAAMHNVEECELNPSKAFAVNGQGALNLARLSEELNFVLLHISTDYVFDGGKMSPYVESDLPRPLNVYGNTKLSGEYFIRTMAPRHFVVRVSGLFGRAPCRAKGGRNFVTTMLKLARERDEVRVIDDEVLSPTYTRDVAAHLVKLAATEAFGLYHLGAQGQCSWYEFAQAIFDFAQVDVKLKVAGSGEFPAKTMRPRYSALENASLASLGLEPMPPWQDGLRRYLAELQISEHP